jgi:tetratricopeptide (TPR) repeat protein
MRTRLLLILAFLSLSFSSCSAPGDFAAVLRGNARYRSARWEEAAAAYLGVSKVAWKALIAYDLANAWARLGEEKAAETLYAVALRAGDASLRRVAFFNLGVLRYEKGRYQGAYEAFRESLRLDPGDEGARRNLEIAFRDWKKEGETAPSGLSPALRSTGTGPGEDLRILRRLETGTWRPATGASPTSGGRDW